MIRDILLTYSSVLLGSITLWSNIKLFRKIPIWLFFTGLALIFAIIFERASIVSLVYAITYGVITYHYWNTKHIFYFLLIIGLSLPLFSHLPILGFNNFQYLDHVLVSENGIPYSLYFNLDKTLIGIFLIGFSTQSTKLNWLPLLKKVFILLFFMSLIFSFLGITLEYIKFAPKLPYFTPIWILKNLFFTCLAEEAFFRKFLQEKIHDSLNSKLNPTISILIAAIIFGIFHFKGGAIYVILATIAGLFYGYIFHKTKRVESSILLHFSFNLVHFIFFTYPALKV